MRGNDPMTEDDRVAIALIPPGNTIEAATAAMYALADVWSDKELFLASQPDGGFAVIYHKRPEQQASRVLVIREERESNARMAFGRDDDDPIFSYDFWDDEFNVASMVSNFAELLKRHNVVNYVTMSVKDGKTGEVFECTVRRSGGMTPAQKIATLERTLDERTEALCEAMDIPYSSPDGHGIRTHTFDEVVDQMRGRSDAWRRLLKRIEEVDPEWLDDWRHGKLTP